VLVNGSWPSAAATGTSRPLALTGALGIPLLPCLADLLLLGWRYRATLEDSSHEQPAQEASKILTHYSMT